MREEPFYLVRSDKCYSNSVGLDFGPQADEKEAERVAVAQATRLNKPIGVYKLVLVGVAEPPQATYKYVRKARK